MSCVRGSLEWFRTGVLHAVGLNSEQTFFFQQTVTVKFFLKYAASPKLLEILGKLAFRRALILKESCFQVFLTPGCFKNPKSFKIKGNLKLNRGGKVVLFREQGRGRTPSRCSVSQRGSAGRSWVCVKVQLSRGSAGRGAVQEGGRQ